MSLWKIGRTRRTKHTGITHRSDNCGHRHTRPRPLQLCLAPVTVFLLKIKFNKKGDYTQTKSFNINQQLVYEV